MDTLTVSENQEFVAHELRLKRPPASGSELVSLSDTVPGRPDAAGAFTEAAIIVSGNTIRPPPYSAAGSG